MALVDAYNGFIFDYGGVLVHPQTEADQARLAGMAGIDPAHFTELYWSDRLEYDKAHFTGPEYWEHVARRAGAALSSAAIEELTEFDTVSWMQFDSIMWDWIDQLRAAGKSVAILSNMPRDLGEALKERTDKLNHFDYVTLSYEVRSVKPEPEIYEHCLEGLGTEPGKTLFLDDRIVNVQGAELLGIRAVQFTSRDEVLLRLSG